MTKVNYHKDQITSSGLITTIIPTFRRPKLVRRAIKSVLAQTYPHVRVCIYDDASNDETADVLAGIIKEDSRVSYYCHPKNVGSVSNYNYAFKNIRTPFFSLLSDDDILLPEFYEIAIKGLNNYPEAVFFATDVIHLEPDGTVADKVQWGDSYYLPPEGLLAMYENGRYPQTWTGTLFRTIVIEHIGLLDEEVGTIYDHDYSQRIVAHFPYATSKIPGAIYLINPVSMTVAIDHSLAWTGALKMIRNLMDDNSISLFAREQVSLCLMKNLISRVIGYGIQSIISKKYDGAYKAANILYRHLNAKLWAIIIYITTMCCRFLPFFQRVVSYLINLRRRLISKKNRKPLPEKYEQYLKDL